MGHKKELLSQKNRSRQGIARLHNSIPYFTRYLQRWQGQKRAMHLDKKEICPCFDRRNRQLRKFRPELVEKQGPLC